MSWRHTRGKGTDKPGGRSNFRFWQNPFLDWGGSVVDWILDLAILIFYWSKGVEGHLVKKNLLCLRQDESSIDHVLDLSGS